MPGVPGSEITIIECPHRGQLFRTEIVDSVAATFENSYRDSTIPFRAIHKIRPLVLRGLTKDLLQLQMVAARPKISLITKDD